MYLSLSNITTNKKGAFNFKNESNVMERYTACCY